MTDGEGIVEMIARDELEAGRWCEKPRRVKGSWARCGSQDFASCRYCAGISSLYVKKIISAGLAVGDSAYYFLTLTAPSFGKVHSFLRDENVICRCGSKHSGNEFAGVPLDSRRYRYREQIRFNEVSGELFRYSMQRFARQLNVKSVPWCAVREYQQRGAIHFHIIVRVPKLTPRRDVENAFAAMRGQELAGVKWGRSADLKLVAGDGEETVRYLAKLVGYSVKSLGKSESLLSDEQRKFYVRLDETAREMGLSEKRVKGFGYGGHLFTKSKTWADVTKQSLRDEAKEFAETHDVSNADKEIAYRLVDERWRADLRALGSYEDFSLNALFKSEIKHYVKSLSAGTPLRGSETPLEPPNGLPVGECSPPPLKGA